MLGEIGTFFGGLIGKSKQDFQNGNALYATYKNIYMNLALDLNITERVRISPDEKQNSLLYGDILFTGSSETPDECAMSSVVMSEPKEPIYINSFSFAFRFNDLTDIEPGFYKHLFRSNRMRKELAKTASGVTRFNVSKKRMTKISIPLPPLAEQQRIVAILDKFETLVSSISEGLPREIALRRNAI